MSTKSDALYSMTGAKLSRQEAQVMEAFADNGGMAYREWVAEYTGLRIASVCGRVDSLMKKGVLIDRGNTTVSEFTGKTVQLLEVA